MPKGILIPHMAFASSIRGHGEVLRFTTGPGSRNFQFTAYSSDVHLGEIFTSLAFGSCVCVPSDWDRKNNIAGAMRDLGVNTMQGYLFGRPMAYDRANDLVHGQGRRKAG